MYNTAYYSDFTSYRSFDKVKLKVYLQHKILRNSLKHSKSFPVKICLYKISSILNIASV